MTRKHFVCLLQNAFGFRPITTFFFLEHKDLFIMADYRYLWVQHWTTEQKYKTECFVHLFVFLLFHTQGKPISFDLYWQHNPFALPINCHSELRSIHLCRWSCTFWLNVRWFDGMITPISVARSWLIPHFHWIESFSLPCPAALKDDYPSEFGKLCKWKLPPWSTRKLYRFALGTSKCTLSIRVCLQFPISTTHPTTWGKWMAPREVI